MFASYFNYLVPYEFLLLPGYCFNHSFFVIWKKVQIFEIQVTFKNKST
jgi:hypothetical protein